MSIVPDYKNGWRLEDDAIRDACKQITYHGKTLNEYTKELMDKKFIENLERLNQDICRVTMALRETEEDFVLTYITNYGFAEEKKLSKDDLRRALYLLSEERAGRVVVKDAEKMDKDAKKGKWITCYRENNLTLTGIYCYRGCSVCGYERDDDDERKDTPYCPQCGAEMR